MESERTPQDRALDKLKRDLKFLETRVDGALNAAYVNYDPLVNQLSELRREFAKVLVQDKREHELMAERDQLWCLALATTVTDIKVLNEVLVCFNGLRPVDG